MPGLLLMLAAPLRLTRQQDFEAVRRQGKQWRGRLLSLYVLPNDRPHPRFGFVASRRVGKAVVRNRMKRRLRAAVRQWLDTISGGHDIVIIIHPAAAEAPYRELAAHLGTLLGRAGLLVTGR